MHKIAPESASDVDVAAINKQLQQEGYGENAVRLEGDVLVGPPNLEYGIRVQHEADQVAENTKQVVSGPPAPYVHRGY